MSVRCQVYLHFLDKGCDLLSVAIKRVALFNPNFLGVVVIGVMGYGGKRVQVGVENEAESFCSSLS